MIRNRFKVYFIFYLTSLLSIMKNYYHQVLILSSGSTVVNFQSKTQFEGLFS